jgi:hypothetical protein
MVSSSAEGDLDFKRDPPPGILVPRFGNLTNPLDEILTQRILIKNEKEPDSIFDEGNVESGSVDFKLLTTFDLL